MAKKLVVFKEISGELSSRSVAENPALNVDGRTTRENLRCRTGFRKCDHWDVNLNSSSGDTTEAS